MKVQELIILLEQVKDKDKEIKFLHAFSRGESTDIEDVKEYETEVILYDY